MGTFFQKSCKQFSDCYCRIRGYRKELQHRQNRFYAVSLAVTCDSKFSASVLIILRLLVDLNRTCFEFVVELYIDSQINVAVGKLDILRLGSFISRIYVDFGYGI